MLRHIQRRSKTHNEELLQALITAQQEHTKMLAEQMQQTKELADRSSVSTQTALLTARHRLYVAGAAFGLGAI
jgi:hypothetical protein